MKNKFSKIVISALLVSSSIMADDSVISYSYDGAYSFVAIESLAGRLDVEGPTSIDKYNMYGGGVKIGAQTDSYKIYLNANYYDADGFDYMATYGVGLQYMFKFSKVMNAFLGVNTGMANMRFLKSVGTSRTISDPYIGGEAGLNLHLGDDLDLEIGARLLSIDATNTINGVTYTFDNMLTGYASINFKWKMD